MEIRSVNFTHQLTHCRISLQQLDIFRLLHTYNYEKLVHFSVQSKMNKFHFQFIESHSCNNQSNKIQTLSNQYGGIIGKIVIREEL